MKNKPSVYNKGFLTGGEFNSKNKSYQRWRSMLKRCYCEKYQTKQPTYIGCLVIDEWLNFENFAKWDIQNYKETYQLDKDCLFKGNKIYSPNTCEYVPLEINNLFNKSKINKKYNLPIGVCLSKNKINKYRVQLNQKFIGSFDNIDEAFNTYKILKEKQIKLIANKYKNNISEKYYIAMLNYKIEKFD